MSIASNWRRPESLAEIPRETLAFRDFGYLLSDFLHEFQAHPGMAKLAVEPPLLAGRFAEGEIVDAYLAAVAVCLSASLREARPGWTQTPCRYLPKPWFASPGPHLRACLLLESPHGFRERNLFVTA